MKRFHYALITAAFAALLLSACGSADTDTAGSSGDNFLVVLNYGKYLDASAIKMFEQETGIKIKLEEYESPEEMYTMFSAGSISYDVVCTSDYMVERLIHEGKVAPIDFSSFSYYKNLNPAILAAAEVFDPQNQYSMPYFYGTLGILYNTTMVSEEETESWNILWDDRYRDTIIMQNSVRASFVPALRLLGRDINTEDETDLRDALSLLVEQKPLVYAYYVDETADEMIAGNAALALVYSGEAATAMESNADLSYTVPKEGSNLWIDSWFIPADSTHKENAEKFLDFLCRKDVAMLNFDYICYATPNQTVVDALDEDTRNDTTIFSPDNVFASCTVYKQLGSDTTELYSYLWKTLKSEWHPTFLVILSNCFLTFYMIN